MHTYAFEARANGDLATSLDNTRGSAQALGVELRVAHTFSVGLEIVQATARVLGTGYVAPNGREQRSTI